LIITGDLKNKFTVIRVPLEFRWRSSTFESYKFWRIYGGVKFSYLLYDKSVLKTAGTKRSCQTLMIFYTAFICQEDIIPSIFMLTTV
jgi:hypothetical protein